MIVVLMMVVVVLQAEQCSSHQHQLPSPASQQLHQYHDHHHNHNLPHHPQQSPPHLHHQPAQQHQHHHLHHHHPHLEQPAPLHEHGHADQQHHHHQNGPQPAQSLVQSSHHHGMQQPGGGLQNPLDGQKPIGGAHDGQRQQPQIAQQYHQAFQHATSNAKESSLGGAAAASSLSHTIANTMQQVLLEADPLASAAAALHIAHRQFEYKQESFEDGELRAFYLEEFQSASFPLDQLDGPLDGEQQHHNHAERQHPPPPLQPIHHHHHHQASTQYQYVQQQQAQQTIHQQTIHQHHVYQQTQPHSYQQQQQLDPNHQTQPQQHCYQEHHHYLMYSHQYNTDDRDINNNLRPLESSCSSQDQSTVLTQPVQQTCKAATSLVSTNNVPNILHNKASQNSNVESFIMSPGEMRYQYENSLMGAIRHYWREVCGLCIGSAIFLNWLFVFVKRRLYRVDSIRGVNHGANWSSQQQPPAARTVSKDTNTSSAHDSAFEETASSPLTLVEADRDISSKSSSEKSTNSAPIPVSASTHNTQIAHRHRSSTLKAEPIPIPIPRTPRQHNSNSASLSNSLSTSEYNSRYSSDFESIQRLGRGGFGVVFEARNKIDDCHYAVKRICLPLEKDARERVMREVRSLAKLDHAGIVRYYNAWLETPPEDWLKQHDAQLGIVNSKDGMSFPSTDGIYERTEHQTTKGGKSGSGESGDTSSDPFGNAPFNNFYRRPKGFKKSLLRNDSSTPSLDIVFEGSGSIRLESENSTEKLFDSSEDNIKRKHSRELNTDHIGDNYSDSEDGDFIKFESKGNNSYAKGEEDNGREEDFSISSHLTEPFSSSSSENSSGANGDMCKIGQRVEQARKNALNYQKELRQLNNVPLIDSLHSEKVYLYIQMQLCRKDTLRDWLKTNCGNRDKTIIFDLFYQIVDAVEYVHSQDLIHRDLKPSNIFFSLDGTLKIGDFGLCRTKTSAGIGSSLDLQEYVAEADVEKSFEAVHTEQVGTQLYMSPEQLNGLSYNQKVDIFAMGLILIELLVPFKTQMQRVNVLIKARNNLYSDEFRNEHPREHELVKALLNRSPLKRPAATEIKQHELLASAQLSQPVIERIYHRRRTLSSNSSSE